MGRHLYFNTSHVTVKLKCDLLVHLLFYHFNTSHVTVKLAGDTVYMASNSNFNTSHVTVKQRGYDHRWRKERYFNTSHVTVKREREDTFTGSITKFQYISCYCQTLAKQDHTESEGRISIHLMLLSNIAAHKALQFPILISIHLMLLSNIALLSDCSSLFGFQYISCYCQTIVRDA